MPSQRREHRIQNAWPVKYTLSPLESDGNAVAVETLTIAHEGFQRVDDR